MADESRIEELRGRVRKDPASIAFAQLAEELRRAGQFAEAVEVCRTGLSHSPEYVSARVTLGRALIGLNQLGSARRELEQVRNEAPDNLAAVRALAELSDKQRFVLDTPDYLGERGKSGAPRPPLAAAECVRMVRTLTALEAWLTAIHVTRAE